MEAINIKKLLYHILNSYPIGSCYTTTTRINPASWLGGEWTLINKQFTPTTITSGFTFNTTYTQNGAFEARLSGNTIHFRLYWYKKTAISDNTIDIGTLTKSDVGISAGPSAYPVGYNDYLSAIGMFIINFGTAADTTTTLQVLDWTTTATTKPTTTNQTCDLSFIINFTPDEMLDNFCNQFIWKRIS